MFLRKVRGWLVGLDLPVEAGLAGAIGEAVYGFEAGADDGAI